MALTSLGYVLSIYFIDCLLHLHVALFKAYRGTDPLQIERVSLLVVRPVLHVSQNIMAIIGRDILLRS